MVENKLFTIFCPTVLNPDVCTILILKKDLENQHDWLEKFQQFEDAFPIQQGGFTGSHVENPKHGILSWTPGPEALGDRPPLMKIFFQQAELDTWKVYHPPWN